MKAVYVSGRETDELRVLGRRAVRHVMSSPVICVTAQTSLEQALRTMIRGRCRHLVVVDDAGRCLGVLADRAVAAAWANDPNALSRATVGALIDPAPAIVDESVLVVDAARLMRSGGVDAVAVVNRAGHAVGILTGTDLIALLAR